MKEQFSFDSNELIFYTNADGNIRLEVFYLEESFWLSQKKMSDLFGVESNTITYHLNEIYQSGELDQDSTTRKIRVVQKEGARDVSREVLFYNLDAIISVGYRVNSQSATRFRIWATGILRDYLVKGFVMDDERLKQGESLFNKDYFDELIDFSLRPLRLCVELINTILLSIKLLKPNRFFQRMFFYESNKSISCPFHKLNFLPNFK
jgi:hypothetical protein